MVIADEILGMARRLTKGIKVDEETLALDVIGKLVQGEDLVKKNIQKHRKKTMLLLHQPGHWEIFEKPAERHNSSSHEKVGYY